MEVFLLKVQLVTRCLAAFIPEIKSWAMPGRPGAGGAVRCAAGPSHCAGACGPACGGPGDASLPQPAAAGAALRSGPGRERGEVARQWQYGL